MSSCLLLYFLLASGLTWIKVFVTNLHIMTLFRNKYLLFIIKNKRWEKLQGEQNLSCRAIKSKARWHENYEQEIQIIKQLEDHYSYQLLTKLVTLLNCSRFFLIQLHHKSSYLKFTVKVTIINLYYSLITVNI